MSKLPWEFEFTLEYNWKVNGTPVTNLTLKAELTRSCKIINRSLNRQHFTETFLQYRSLSLQNQHPSIFGNITACC